MLRALSTKGLKLTRAQRFDPLFTRLYELYHHRNTITPEVHKLYWSVATKTRRMTHAELDVFEDAVNALVDADNNSRS